MPAHKFAGTFAARTCHRTTKGCKRASKFCQRTSEQPNNMTERKKCL